MRDDNFNPKRFFSVLAGVFLLVSAAVAFEGPQPRMVQTALVLPAQPSQGVSQGVGQGVSQGAGTGWSTAEIECIARTIYGESRNQPYHGQVAVGAVIVARSLSTRWPSDLCAVVSQSGQFGGFYTGKIREPKAWAVALKAANHATAGFGSLPESYRTSFFFRNRTDPSFIRWATPKGVIGDHLFYTIKA